MLKISRKKYALDLGSGNTRLWGLGRGMLISEPTVLAFSAGDGALVAVGNDAKIMLGKLPETLTSYFPIQNGVISDIGMSASFIKTILRRDSSVFEPLGPDIMVNVPNSATQVERKAVLETLLKSGASHVFLVDTLLAGALGAGIPITTSSGSMIASFGAEVTEAAVVSLGGIVVSDSKKIGTNALDKAIIDYIKKKHGIIIGSQLAENIKIKIASAIPLIKDQNLEISGRDTTYGVPRSVIITTNEMIDSLYPVLSEILAPVRNVLENIPPELASDIIEKGIMMIGGGAKFKSLDRLLTSETGIPSQVAEEPELCVVRGSGAILTNLELWKRSISSK